MLTITIRTDNAAFEIGAQYELARIVKDTAEEISNHDAPFVKTLYDSNGNRVGTAVWTED